MANLLALRASAGLVAGVAPLVALAHAHGQRLRVDELNAVTCQGRYGVSDTFATSLWVIDALFRMARIGVDGVNVHVWTGAAPNQLFTFTHRGGSWRASIRPLYFGLLAFVWSAPAGSRVLAVRGALRGVRSWATLAPDGKLRMVMVNVSSDRPAALLVRAVARRGPATLVRLRAPALTSRTGVTLAGQRYPSQSATGQLVGARVTQAVRSGAGGYALSVPPASAALLTIP